MDAEDISYLRRATSFTSLENLRSVVGIILGLFLVLWIRNPVGDENLSDRSLKTQSLLVALVAFYFIFDFYISRSMAMCPTKTEDILKYPKHFRVCVMIQFVLLAVVIMVGGNLVWSSTTIPAQEPMVRKMIVVFLSLYIYKLFSVFYVYHIIINSYEYFRFKVESGIEDKDSPIQTKPKLQEV